MIYFGVEYYCKADHPKYAWTEPLDAFITSFSNSKDIKRMRLYYYPTINYFAFIYVGPTFGNVKKFVCYAKIMQTLLQ